MAVSGYRCPLASLASGDADGCRENFGIHVPVWLGRQDKLVLGALYIAGDADALAQWMRA